MARGGGTYRGGMSNNNNNSNSSNMNSTMSGGGGERERERRGQRECCRELASPVPTLIGGIEQDL